MGRIVEEKTVYLYELTAERFKEIKGILKKSDDGKAFIVRGDNGKIVNVSCEESKVFKNNYVWMEKRCKANAAKVFQFKLEKDLKKEQEFIDILIERKDILDKYFETVKN